MMNSKLGTVSGLGAILLWSATFAVARSLTEQIGPLTSGAAAYLLGGAFFMMRLWRGKQSIRQVLDLPLPYLLGCGGLFIAYTATIYLAVGLAKSREQMLEIAMVNYLWPGLTILLSIPILKQKARWWLVPGTVLALGGIILVMTQGSDLSWAAFQNRLSGNPVVYILALVAAVSWALYSNLTRRWAQPGTGAVELFLLATGLVLVGLRLLTTEPTHWSWRSAIEVAVLAAITALAYMLWDVAMRRGNLLLVVACSYFTPLLSTLVSCAYLGVVPGSQLWMGCALLVCGSLLSWSSVTDNPR